jgi:hypothetical protein
MNEVTKITHEGITFDHPQIMRDGTIQIVINGAYYEFPMKDILQETKNNRHPEDWVHDMEQLHETFDTLSQDIATITRG